MVKSVFVKLSWHSKLKKQLYIHIHCHGTTATNHLVFNISSNQSQNTSLSLSLKNSFWLLLFHFQLKLASYLLLHYLQTLLNVCRKKRMGILSRKVTCNSHGQDSSYFLGWQEYEKNPYDEVKNPKGIIQMGLAENQVRY